MKLTQTLIILGLGAVITLPVQAESEAWPGTLYRNGGHFGMANSDVILEQPAVIAGAPSSDATEPEATPSQTWSGTLYRNGGHDGLNNSDEKLESVR
jgi:cell wall-associated NlpC family hydrolase